MSVTRSHSIKRFFLFPSIVLAVVLFAEFPVRFAWSFFPHQVDIEDSSYIIPDPILDHVMQPGGDSGALDKNGYLLRIGTKAITNGGWWWAIPTDWAAPELSYKLFKK
ncbi:MAG: hypothetical protein UY04_C0048G0001, partial [Parcubacteria group bacterium GW2011_GWA2_47_7]